MSGLLIPTQCMGAPYIKSWGVQSCVKKC
uniref:Uncharacterized protein n=1 Tax=Anguilla anguilla TaxID=7936 RepID=A0A0E9VUV0_ANGAN